MKSFSSNKFKNQKVTAAFTLIEMVTVIGIFVIVTGIILANLPAYRSSSALDLVAQEVATQVRGAQIYSMSTVVGKAAGDVFGYLIQVPSSSYPNQKDFKLCACRTFGDYNACLSGCNLSENIIETYNLGGKVHFNNTIPINLYFKRPMGGLLRDPGLSNPPVVFSIEVTDGANSRYIKVSYTGSISISSTP